jgi:Tfp pilus assembly protein PilN
MDLEPDEYRREKIEKRRKTSHHQAYVLFAGGLCVAAVVVNELVLKQQDFAKIEKRESNLTKLVKTGLDAKTSDLAKVGPKAKQLKLAFMPAQKISDVTKVATMLIPKGVWLTSLNLERGKLLQLRGSAKTSEAVASYVGELSKQSRFRDVRLVFANAGELEGEKIIQFNITAFPVGNLPLIQASKKKK